MNVHPKYRSDIDGLRALAIALVVIFHAVPDVLPGGFVGVDVFFVISGYLISSIIFSSLERKEFSFIEFYRKRVLRIFPALVLVLLFCVLFGFFCLTPREYSAVGRHVVGGALFSSNVILWSEAGYFDAAAESKPLLHLWSLGVEEQFYIIWPFLLLLIWKYASKRILLFVTSMLALSFVVNIVQVGASPVATFYLPFSRFWELLIGACLAWFQLRPEQFRIPESRFLPAIQGGNIRALLGLILILASAFFVRSSSAFPGWWAVLPTAGCALVISAGHGAWLNRNVLASRGFVFLGKISYPLYLWHWPLMTFARLLGFGSLICILASIAVSLLLSFITYRFVERHVRHTRDMRILSAVVVSMALVALSGLLIVSKDGFSSRFNNMGMVETIYPTLWRQGECFLNGAERSEKFSAACVDPKKPEKRPLIVIWGDSHSAQLYPAFNELQRSGYKFRIAQFSTSSCPPLLNYDYPSRHACRHHNQVVIGQIAELKPAYVLLAADWHDADYDLKKLDETVSALKALKVPEIWLMGTVPRWPQPLPRYLTNMARLRLDHEMPDRVVPLDATLLDQRLVSSAKRLGIHYVSPKERLCNGDGCLVSVRDKDQVKKLTSFDICHLTLEGARPVVQEILSRFGLQPER